MECLDIWLGTESGYAVKHLDSVGIEYPLAIALSKLIDSCPIKSF